MLSRILILGGYGGFGARLSRRLAARGHHILIAGRSLDRAAAFCRGLTSAEPVVMDRDRPIDELLQRHRPGLLIDAAGPFQGSGYEVPRACARASVHYLDLADARDFVTGIAVLDPAARQAGIAIITGASSVPALSGAVARALAVGMDEVRAVDTAISASNRATTGASVARAILSYVGRPVRVWRGRRWVHRWGWQDLRRSRFALADRRMRGRWLALADVPDLHLMPAMLPGRPAATFHAGTESAIQTLGLWLLSWPARLLGLRLSRLAPLLLPIQRLTGRPSSDRSAMSVKLVGRVGDNWFEREWVLLAERGDGPEIPTLAAVLLAKAILAGSIAPGARDAAGLLSLAEVEPLFATLAVRHEARARPLPPALYRRLLGPAYAMMPAALQAMHDIHRDDGASGEGEVIRGGNPIARLVGRIMRFPPAGQYPVHVDFAERRGSERWTRHFGHHAFASQLSQAGGLLTERFGPLRFGYLLSADANGLEMHLRRWSFLHVRLPLVLGPRIAAREWQAAERFHFDVAAGLPLIGPVVRYRGWLRREV